MLRNGLMLLILGYLTVYILPLDVRPLVIPDETRYAQMGREIIQSGDWVVPHLDGLRYFEKPILGHWAHALSIRCLGANAFAARLPSALSAGLSALLLILLMRRFGGAKHLSLLCGGMFLTFIEVYIVGTLCVLDSLLSLFVTGTMVAFFFAYHESNPARQRIYMALFGLAAGLAFLTKGLLGFVLPGVAIIPFLLWQRKIGPLWRHLWIVICVILATAGPWLILIQRREPDFLHYFFWIEHVERFLHPNGGQHREPLWYFLPVIIGGAFPWTLLWFPAGLGLRKASDPLGFLKYSACWLVFPFLFLSASGGKLATYILPCFVPLSILIVIGLQTYWSVGKPQHLNGALRVGIILALLGLVSLLASPLVKSIPPLYGTDEGGKVVLVALGLLIMGMGWWWAQRLPTFESRLTLTLLAPVFLLTCIPWALPDRFKTRKMPGDFLTQHASYLSKQNLLFSDETLTPAVCWFANRSDVMLLGEKGELEYGLNYKDARDRFLPTLDFQTFRKNHPQQTICFVTREGDYREDYQGILPDPTVQIKEDGFMLLEYAPLEPLAAQTEPNVSKF